MSLLSMILAVGQLVDIRDLPGNNCYPAIQRHAPELLKEYRYPAASDLEGYWEFFIGEYGEVPFCASGDLNGDGVVDYLAVLLKRRQPGARVVAMLSRGGGARSAHVLFESPTSDATDQLVVDFVQKGEHRYLCAYLFDDVNAAPTIRLAWPVARFYRRSVGEASDPTYLFHWSPAENKFVRTKPCGEK